MSYWRYPQPSSPGHPLDAVNTPPSSTYYSPRVAPYGSQRMGPEDYGYSLSPGTQYHYEYVSDLPSNAPPSAVPVKEALPT